MRILPVLLAALLVPGTASAAEEKDDTVEFVTAVLKVETADIPPELIPRFMSVEASVLPKKMRSQFLARKTELETLRKLSAGKRKPPVRRLGKEPPTSCDEKTGNPSYLSWMKTMGFFEITEDEAEWLQKKTKCNYCELMEEFSFTPVIVTQMKKGKKKERKHYLLHYKDPLEAYIGQYRKTGSAKSGTNFFGSGFLGACH